MAMRLFKRGKIWYVELNRDVRRSLGTTDEREARRLFKIAKAEHLKGKLIQLDQSERITFGDYSRLYVESRYDLAEMTLAKDRTALKNFGEVIGESKPVKMIRVGDIDQFKRVCIARGVTPIGLNSYLRHIRAALNRAVELGFIEEPIPVKLVKTGRTLPRVLSKPEIRLLLNHALSRDFQFYRIILFALWTGCRKFEILGLTHSDVKGDSAVIRGKGGKERILPLMPGALEAIGETKDIGLVFKQYERTWVSQKFKIFARECSIQGVHFHTLRHSAATHMISSGIPLEVVQKILGHSSITTTQIYAQVVDDLVKREMQKLTF